MEQINKVRYDDDGHGRKYEVSVQISDPTQRDQEEFNALGFHIDLSDRVRIYVQNNDRYKSGCAKTFMERETFERLGVDYIAAHAKLDNSRYLGFMVVISQNDYFNDLSRNPERVIPVRFVKTENGTGREIYRGLENDRYYAREVYFPRESCAKWFCYGGNANAGDGNLPRPNIIFECDGQREKVTYDDWNDVMAYSGTFNENFNK